MRSSIQTFSGRLIEPFNLKVEDVDPVDIAHALGNICRFTGHCSMFYSVLEHSLNVAFLVRYHLGGKEEDYIKGLLHDAAEAYLCDVASPIKHHPKFSFYRKVEEDIMNTIWARFNLPGGQDLVHQADKIMLGIEARHLMNADQFPERWPSLESIPKGLKFALRNYQQDIPSLRNFWLREISKWL